MVKTPMARAAVCNGQQAGGVDGAVCVGSAWRAVCYLHMVVGRNARCAGRLHRRGYARAASGHAWTSITTADYSREANGMGMIAAWVQVNSEQ
jgi:hypothetical protein